MFVITQEGRDANAAAVKAAGMPGGPLHIDQQGPLAPARLAELRQTGDGAPLSSPYRDHAAAAVTVQGIDAAGASGAGNLAQFGPRWPSGDPARIAAQPEHTAPTGADSGGFRVNAARQGAGVPALPGVVPHGPAGQADVRAALVPAEAMRGRLR